MRMGKLYNYTSCTFHGFLYTALAVYTRSPAAYEALSSFKILQLPSINTIRSYMKSNKENPGIIEKRLADERGLYDERCLSHTHTNKPKPPLRKGVLIFDEVKVAAKLHWNSKDDTIVGHSMTVEEMATLQDIYQTIDPSDATAKTDYVLQTLWRDLSTEHDIVGYYTSCGRFSTSAMLACVFDTLQKFDQFGFSIMAMVCDGASAI